jgi:hypothetical protein
MVDIQTVSIAIASAGVFAAAIYYIFQIRHQTRLRQTDLVIRLYSTWGSKEFQEAYEKTMIMEIEDYSEIVKRGKLQADVNTVSSFFEGIGILLHRKLVDIGLVDDLFRESVNLVWNKVKPVLYEARKQSNLPYGRWFEYLYNEMKKREQQQAKTQ